MNAEQLEIYITLVPIVTAIVAFISAAISLISYRQYSPAVRLLKFITRGFVGLVLIVLPFIPGYVHLMLATGLDHGYDIVDQIMLIKWAIIIFFGTDILLQVLNLKYGRLPYTPSKKS